MSELELFKCIREAHKDWTDEEIYCEIERVYSSYNSVFGPFKRLDDIPVQPVSEKEKIYIFFILVALVGSVITLTI